jgi:FdhE protein
LADPLADDLASLMLDLLMADTPYARASENPWLALAAPGDEPETDE